MKMLIGFRKTRTKIRRSTANRESSYAVSFLNCIYVWRITVDLQEVHHLGSCTGTTWESGNEIDVGPVERVLQFLHQKFSSNLFGLNLDSHLLIGRFCDERESDLKITPCIRDHGETLNGIVEVSKLFFHWSEEKWSQAIESDSWFSQKTLKILFNWTWDSEHV